MTLLKKYIRNWNKVNFCNRKKVFIYFIIISIITFIYGSVNSDISVEVLDNNKNIFAAYNVILILLDSIRADHLGCYGYQRSTSPAIDKLAREGVLFERAISQSTWSLPSHCCILTSRYVPAHGVDGTNKKLADSELTLPEILKIYGYKTVAFTGGFWIHSTFNVGKGFDIYRDELTFAKLKDTSAQALDWLKEHKQDRFFLFLQGFDGHSPFNLPKAYEEMYADAGYNGVFKKLTLDHRIGDRIFGHTFFIDYEYKNKVSISDADIDYIIAHYDGSIAYADYYIGEFLKKLDELNLNDNTIVILTSYHGTSLFEHGIILRRLHGGLTEGSIHVPLIIRHPGIHQKGKRVNLQAQLIDLMPTILEFLGIPINHQAQGRSLVPLVEDRAGLDFNQYVYSSGFKEKAIRTTKWKLIESESENKNLELFNLQKDPLEQNNVSKNESKIAYALKQKLDKWFEEQKLQNSKETNIIEEYKIWKIKATIKKAGYWFLDLPKDKEVIGRQIPERLKSRINER